MTSRLQQYRDLAFESIGKIVDSFDEDTVLPADFQLSNIYRTLANLPKSPNTNPYIGLFGLKSLKEHRQMLVNLLDSDLFNCTDVCEVDYRIDAFIRQQSDLPERPTNRAVYQGLYKLPKKEKVVKVEVEDGERKPPKSYKMSQAGVDLIKEFEGLHLRAYPDPGSWDGKPITIGYGSTRLNGRPVQLREKITLAQAEAQLAKDLVVFENAVRKSVLVPLTQGEYDALVSFCYNAGIYDFKTSTLLKELNRKQYEAAFVVQLQRWTKGGDKDGDGKKDELDGLIRRRKAEANLAGYNIA